MKSDVLRIALIVFLILFFSCFERMAPAHVSQSWSGKIRNVGYITIFLLFGSLASHLLSPVFQYVHPRMLVISGWYILLVVLLSLMLADFFFYWYHRAEHYFGWLWLIHELHHSDTELNVTTSMRTYWLESPLQALIISLPVQLLIGVNTQVQWIFLCVATSWLYFAHANIRLPLGPLTPFICGPQLHRIHHSIEPRHHHKNFAQFFPVFDILFGTYYAPVRDEFPGTGTKGLPTDASYLSVLVRPFRCWFKGGKC
ncbi:sterol desaturase family protein [Candidatus Uhrbacteria bacterium]|nr:sterol desaturase family protein [Candidatus Uhrbacteria bacterium]